MTIDFSSLLSPEQRKNIIERRIAMYINEGYSQQVNLEVAEKIGDEESAQQSKILMENISNAIAALEVALSAASAEISSVESSED